mgnify:CR=1 FL=1
MENIYGFAPPGAILNPAKMEQASDVARHLF